MRILVTGAAGAIGRALVPALEQAGHKVFPTDIDNMDVTSSGDVWNVTAQTAPEVIVHLAASKLAVEGELNPVGFTRTNILGTFNMIEAAKARQAKLIFSSTCKAADPETVYGACKLVAERAVLSAGGVVVRFYNVLECGPSVKTIWEQIPAPQPIPYTDCWRYFISVARAVEVLELALTLPAGRYAPNPGPARHMRHVAAELYPDRELVEIPRRRGDRAREPLHAACEYATGRDLLQLVGAHDPEHDLGALVEGDYERFLNKARSASVRDANVQRNVVLCDESLKRADARPHVGRSSFKAERDDLLETLRKIDYAAGNILKVLSADDPETAAGVTAVNTNDIRSFARAYLAEHQVPA